MIHRTWIAGWGGRAICHNGDEPTSPAGEFTLGLTVLIANRYMDWPTGTMVYTRDLALELRRQGHRPIVYTWFNGRAGRELASTGIEVVEDLWRIHDRPDVIQGHHSPLIRGALLRFPGVPVVFVCHDPTDPWSVTVPLPGIRRYFGVSELCAKRLIGVGAPVALTGIRPNSVDLSCFTPRSELPARPARALVFSNYATAEVQLPAIQEACRRLGIPLDVVGRGVGNPTDHPERVLGGYDLVFAVGKSALEAMAVGAAVILCSRSSLGPMVTAADFDRVRSFNFGRAALVEPLSPEGVYRQMERYDPADASLVRDLVRSRCALPVAVRGIVEDYLMVVEEAAAARSAGEGTGSAGRSVGQSIATLRYRAATAAMVAFYRTFGLGPRRVPAPIKAPYRAIRAIMRRLVMVR
jgi:hypothetical protein